MRPDDDAHTLDDLLRARAEQAAATPNTPASEAPAALAPLLNAADRLAAGRAIEPSPAFTHALTHRLEAQVNAALAADALAVPQGEPPAWGPLRRVVLRRVVLPRAALLAAALVIALGASLLAIAHSAAPASPLYGLRRFEQGVRVGVAFTSQDRARLHLLYAEQALSSVVESARAQDLPGYRAALATMLDEDDAAARAAATLPTDAERTHAQAGLDALLHRERTALRTALATLGWRDRVATTTALGRIGVAGPSITSALVSATTTTDGAIIWQVTIGGVGFQPGALLLVDDHPRGVVIAESDGVLVASVRDGPVSSTAIIGVGNPDGTAAYTTLVTYAGAGDTSQPTQTPTATLDAPPTATAFATPTATEVVDDSGQSRADRSKSSTTSITTATINAPPIHGHRGAR